MKIMQQVPYRLDIVVVQCNVGMLHIRQKRHALGHIRPKITIAEYGFTAFFIKGFYAIGFNLAFLVKTKSFLYFNFHRQAMGIPARFSANLISFHRLIAVGHILQCSRNDVMNARTTVCRRRTVEEHKFFLPLAFFHRAMQQIHFFPDFTAFDLSFTHIFR